MSRDNKIIPTDFRSYYPDTDSVISEEKERQYMKLLLNRAYGLLVFSTYKENDMRIKDFIVLHINGKPIMVKKEEIIVIAKSEKGTAEIATNGSTYFTDDKYDDVIKRLFDI